MASAGLQNLVWLLVQLESHCERSLHNVRRQNLLQMTCKPMSISMQTEHLLKFAAPEHFDGK